MNIIVCVKQVLISTERLSLTGDNKISEKGMMYDINEWDNYALEEALLRREKLGGIVTAITIGTERADKVLRDCLAKGADKAIRIWDRAIEGSDSIVLARILSEVIKRIEYDLILIGLQAEDDGCPAIGPAIAQLLRLQHATMVTKIELNIGKAKVHRELEDGLEEILEVDLPAVLTVQTGINKPRYPALKGIMKAMKQELILMNLKDIGLSEQEVGILGSKTKVEELYFPQAERAAEILEGKPDEVADKLIGIIREKGLI